MVIHRYHPTPGIPLRLRYTLRHPCTPPPAPKPPPNRFAGYPRAYPPPAVTSLPCAPQTYLLSTPSLTPHISDATRRTPAPPTWLMYTLSRSPLSVATRSPGLLHNAGTADITEKTRKRTRKIAIKKREKTREIEGEVPRRFLKKYPNQRGGSAPLEPRSLQAIPIEHCRFQAVMPLEVPSRDA